MPAYIPDGPRDPNQPTDCADIKIGFENAYITMQGRANTAFSALAHLQALLGRMLGGPWLPNPSGCRSALQQMLDEVTAFLEAVSLELYDEEVALGTAINAINCANADWALKANEAGVALATYTATINRINAFVDAIYARFGAATKTVCSPSVVPFPQSHGEE